MLSNGVISAIRTYTPIIVGSVLAWLAVHLGLVVNDQTEAALAILLAGLLTAGYWSLVRLLEARWPKVGVLLGVPAKPDYGTLGKQAQDLAEELVAGGPDPTEAAPVEGPVTASQAQAVVTAEAAPPAEPAAG